MTTPHPSADSDAGLIRLAEAICRASHPQEQAAILAVDDDADPRHRAAAHYACFRSAEALTPWLTEHVDEQRDVAAHDAVTTYRTTVQPHIVGAAEVKAWRDAANKIDAGPTFPLLPSIISALLREHADALEAHYATRVTPPELLR